jgi:hypothetical protein
VIIELLLLFFRGGFARLWYPRPTACDPPSSFIPTTTTITLTMTKRQALDRNGQTVPCLVRVRYMFLNQGSYCAMVVSFFPLPATVTEVRPRVFFK